MILPQQLQNEEFKFVLIRKGEKAPLEYEWQSRNNYKFNNLKITNWKDPIGIVSGYGKLIVLDIDDVNLIEEFDKKTDTFTVKTGSEKRHYYFLCGEAFVKNFYVLGNKQGELRVKNSQVLCPGSLHPSGNKYEVIKDLPIKIIDKKELKILLGEMLNCNNRYRITDQSRSGIEWREVCSMVEDGYNYDECDREMILLNFERWIESNMAYKINTYCNALKHIKEKQNIYK